MMYDVRAKNENGFLDFFINQAENYRKVCSRTGPHITSIRTYSNGIPSRSERPGQ